MEHIYIIGHPVAHSKSPVMCNALYRHLALDWRYDVMDVDTAEQADDFLENGSYLALNATMPYKPNAFAAAQVRAATAKLAGGANLLVTAENGSRIGYNTDGTGCIRYLQRCGINFTGAAVVVCGTGPTACAILHAAAMAGAQRVVLLSRDKQRSKTAINTYLETFHSLAHATIDVNPSDDIAGGRTFRQAYEQTEFKFGAYESSTKAIGSADIIIDATPLGMKPDDPAPFDTTLVQGSQAVMDVVYGHGQSALLRAAREAGAQAFDGAGMLVSQAVQNTQIIMTARHMDTSCTWNDMFDIMADAAHFQC